MEGQDGASFMQMVGDGGADPAGCTGDQDDAAGKGVHGEAIRKSSCGGWDDFSAEPDSLKIT